MLEMQMCHIISDITFSPPFLCPIRSWRSHKYTRSYRWASRVMLPLLYQAEGWKAIPNRKLKSKVIGLHLHDHDVGTLKISILKPFLTAGIFFTFSEANEAWTSMRNLPLRGRYHRVFAAAHPPACSGELSCDCIHTADKISNFILLNAPCISFTMSFAVVK